MHRSRSLVLALVIVTVVIAGSRMQAQSRVFVSVSGLDPNPCSITSPCRTFQRAHDAVASGGEIIALDSAGFGPLTITKSVSIIAPDGLYAGVSATSTDGINIHGENVKVYLRGLTIVGNPAYSGLWGVKMDWGARLVVDRCRIRGFYIGVGIATVAQSSLTVQDCVFDENLYGVDSDLANQFSVVSVLRCTMTGGASGFYISRGKWTIQNTTIKDAYHYGVFVSGLSNHVLVEDCTIAGNSTGIHAHLDSFVEVIGTKIIGNVLGLSTYSTGQLRSGGGNLLRGNGSTQAFDQTFAPE